MFFFRVIFAAFSLKVLPSSLSFIFYPFQSHNQAFSSYASSSSPLPINWHHQALLEYKKVIYFRKHMHLRRKVLLPISVSIDFMELLNFMLEKNVLYKGLYTLDIFAHDVAIKRKRYCDKKIILSHLYLKANQGKLLTKHRVP